MSILRLEKSNPMYSPDNTCTLTVHSSHLGRRHDISIYNVNAKGNDLPVIILLHGVYGNHWVWMQLGGVHLAYEKVKAESGISDFVLVMPSDGGLLDGSAYLPLAQGNYEQWIMDDVIAAVTQSLAQVSVNSRLYITGLSMGGYGALRLGGKFAQRFNGVAAHSSITELSDLRYFVKTPLSNYDCADSNEGNIVYWMEKNKDILPPLQFDCGSDDILFKSNCRFNESLTALGVEHQFEIFDGGHEWPYWHQHVQRDFLFFSKIEETFLR